MRPPVAAAFALSLLLGGSSGCPEQAHEPRLARSEPTRPATTPAPPASSSVPTAPPSAPGVGSPLPPVGRWYALELPAGASRTASAAPEVVDATYVLDASEGLSLAVFRPMPAQVDLEAWTTATEGILEGIPRRHDDATIDGVPARLGTFDDQLRWTFVADGVGGLFRCFADGPRDEAWLLERCGPVVASVRLIRPIRE